MSESLVLGEYARNLDDRFRLSIPQELVEFRLRGDSQCILAKEQPGSLSLWDLATWRKSFDGSLAVVETKLASGRLEGKLTETQELGRLLSSRHRSVQLAGRGRLSIPEGFREFLRVESGGEVIVVGAAVCIEIWHPRAWIQYLRKRIPEFRRLLDQLAS